MLSKGNYYQQKKYFILRKKLIIFILFFVFLLAAIFYTLKGNFFRIKEIHCQINQTECPNSINNQFSSFLNKNILLENFSKKIKVLKNENPSWQSLKVAKKLPDKLLVEIQTLQPLVVLKEIEGNEFYLVDNFGKFVGQKDLNPGLPLVITTNISPPSIGAPLSVTHLGQALELINLFKIYRLIFSNLEIKNHLLIAQFKDFQAVFSPEEDLQKQVASLQLIINEGKIDDKSLKKIDLRFEKPIISY